MAAKSSPGSLHRTELRFVREELEALQTALAAEVVGHGYTEAAAFAIRLAMEEAVVNAHKHGNSGDFALPIRVEWQVGAEAIIISVSDGGGGFDPHSVPDPTSEENLEIPSGRGIMLMRAYMGDVQFVHPGNTVRMTYRRSHA